MAHGAVEFVVVEFPGEVPGPALADELKKLVEGGIVEIIDVLFVRKASDGTLESFELGTGLVNDEYISLDRIIQSVDGLIGQEDVELIGAELHPGHTAAFLIFEHAWLRSIRERLADSGAQVVFTERIPGPVVDEVMAAETA
ncbi:hypothetical protein F4553_005200 [Allocatelliglobosispora scoriae]|uniref:DUF1269 domain-containing protein n=1 Tax=Allocatelliglobosispora scoriae TaxID=643052 RepID=A0A841BYS8_9ACTN|nr:DUF6325 family protein [Allocatelliglobosispora scoriae]MBB5871821.1 hypothetical protein [Allocatelliglobosispora scoriae]